MYQTLTCSNGGLSRVSIHQISGFFLLDRLAGKDQDSPTIYRINETGILVYIYTHEWVGFVDGKLVGIISLEVKDFSKIVPIF